MKKILAFILALSVIFMLGCQKNETSKKLKEEEPVISEPKEEVNEFYEQMQSNKRPIALMIDNDVKASRPQLGLESAYMVYEIIVEGGATRFMALFKEHDMPKVGPVRSARHYFLDYACCRRTDKRYRLHRGYSVDGNDGHRHDDGRPSGQGTYVPLPPLR